jgi:hypothetical protein
MKSINWADQILNFVGVIFGVLLAFYIAELNNSRHERKELRIIVESFIEDLKDDRDTYRDQIPGNEEHAMQIERLMTGIQEEQPDSIAKYLDYLYSADNYSPTSTTYMSVVSSGKLDLIENLSLKKKLSDYYDILATEAEFRGRFQVDYLFEHIIPWVVENVNTTVDPVGQIMGQYQLANHLQWYQGLILNKVDMYQDIRVSAKALTDDLKHFLEEI